MTDDIDDIDDNTWVDLWSRGLSMVLVGQPEAPGTPFEVTCRRVICIMTFLLNAQDEPALSEKQREFRAVLRSDIEQWAPLLIPAYLRTQAEHKLNEAQQQLKQAEAMSRLRRPAER